MNAHAPAHAHADGPAHAHAHAHAHAPDHVPASPRARATLGDPLAIGGVVVRNRLYRAPVLEGAGEAADPAEAYARHFVPNAESGVGLIVQGNTIVLPEGRTSRGMTALAGRGDLLRLAPMVAAVQRAGARIVLQLGHGGVYAIEAWQRERRSARAGAPLAPSRPPLLVRALQGRAHVLATAEVEALVARFGEAAAWAREAGYDAVQLAGANAKLIHQFLSPFYNRRADRFGGGLEGRARLLVEVREAIGRAAGWDYPVLLKYPALEQGPRAGIGLEDGVRLARICEEAGYAALTPVVGSTLPDTELCRGDYPAASLANPALRRRLRDTLGGRARLWLTQAGLWLSSRRYPFAPVWNREVFRAVRAAVRIPVFAVGGIRSVDEARAILASGDADMIGIGRPFYAEPDLAARFLEAASRAGSYQARCESCNRCLVPQMLGLDGRCYNPDLHRAAAAAGAGAGAGARVSATASATATAAVG